MFRISRVVVAVTVVAGLVWVASYLGVAAPSVTPGDGTTDLKVEKTDASGAILAARYHHRNRTSDFFKRAKVSGQSTQSNKKVLAARYHLRGRTSQYFQRATSPSKRTSKTRGIGVGTVVSPSQDHVAARYHLRGRTSKFFDRVADVDSQSEDLLAARYHLRGRTSKFYGRAVG